MRPVYSLKTVTWSDLDSRWQGSDLLCRCCWSHLLCCFALMSWLLSRLSACHPALCLHFPVSVFSVILPCMFALSCVSVLGHIAMYVCTFLCQCSRSYCHVCCSGKVSTAKRLCGLCKGRSGWMADRSVLCLLLS